MSPAALVVVVIFGVLFLLVSLRFVLGAKNREILDRLEREVSGAPRAIAFSAQDDLDEDEGPSLGGFAKSLGKRLGTDEEEASRLKMKLTQAGYRQRNSVETFMGIRVMVLMASALFALFIATNANMSTNAAIFMSLILVSLGLFAPSLVLSSRIQERQKEIGRMLPDAMDLIVICVEAGLSMDQSINRVGQEINVSSPLLSKELIQTALEIEAGVGRADAFRKLAFRTGIEDLRILSAMIIQAEQFGTSIAKSLRLQAGTMRLKRSQKVEEQAAKLPSKMVIPMIMFIMPALFAVLMGPAIVRISKIFSGQSAQ
jgi:tight adherence protein C